MPDTTTVPGLGPVPKKELGIGIAVVAGLVIVYYVRKPKTAASSGTPAASTTVTSDQFPADGSVGNASDPYSTDPASGITYGNESGAGTFSTFGTGIANAPAPTGTVANGPPFSTNAQWSNWVIAQMTANNPQQDPAALTDALGLYLEGQPVDAVQKTLIFDAIAVGGNPPVAGANNYPPNVQTNGSTGPANPPPASAPASGPAPGPSPAVPKVTGMQFAQATAALANAGFGYGGNAKNAGYGPGVVITSQTPGPGAHITYGSAYWPVGGTPVVDLG